MTMLLIRISFEWLEARMDDKFIQETYGDSSEDFCRLDKVNLQKKDTSPENI